MENVFYTQFNRPEKINYEINSGEIKVEKAGYIPAQKRIENLMMAGQRLRLARKEFYDFPEGSELDEDYIDPTRSKNFDMADADQLSEYLEEKAKNGKERILAKAKEKDVQKKDIDQVIDQIETKKDVKN